MRPRGLHCTPPHTQPSQMGRRNWIACTRTTACAATVCHALCELPHRSPTLSGLRKSAPSCRGISLAIAARIDGAADTIWARPTAWTHAQHPAPRVPSEARHPHVGIDPSHRPFPAPPTGCRAGLDANEHLTGHAPPTRQRWRALPSAPLGSRHLESSRTHPCRVRRAIASA